MKMIVFWVIIVLAVVFLSIFLYRKYPEFINTHFNFMQLVISFLYLFLIIIAIIYAKNQIDETRKIGQNKKNIAVEAIIKELEYNKGIVDDYIQHSEVGGNIKERGMVSYELNAPQSQAYEVYFAIAFAGDLEISTKIMYIYQKLETCKVNILHIHQLLANNALNQHVVPDGKQLLENEIKKSNIYLYNTSKEIQSPLDQLIKKLKSVK